MTGNQSAQRWVNEVARMSRPDEVVWCDGSEAEHERLLETAVRAGDLIPLDQRALPGCFLHRSAPTDVARTEHLTFICSREQTDAVKGPDLRDQGQGGEVSTRRKRRRHPTGFRLGVGLSEGGISRSSSACRANACSRVKSEASRIR